jgi:hypothetical protein
MLTFLIWTTIVSFGFVLMGLVADRPLGKEYDHDEAEAWREVTYMATLSVRAVPWSSSRRP